MSLPSKRSNLSSVIDDPAVTLELLLLLPSDVKLNVNDKRFLASIEIKPDELDH